MRFRFSLPLAAALLLAPAAAFAHPGHGPGGWAAGFIHPIVGWDHLLAMAGVGLLAARLGGRARWMLPAAFVSFMLVGGATAWTGFVLPGAEAFVAVTLLAIGAALASTRAPSLPLAASLVALTALLHGCVHGLALPGGSQVAFTLGALVSTAALHAAGVALGAMALRRSDFGGLALRGAGAALAVAGVVFAVAAF
jgi:urease accessory protein